MILDIIVERHFLKRSSCNRETNPGEGTPCPKIHLFTLKIFNQCLEVEISRKANFEITLIDETSPKACQRPWSSGRQDMKWPKEHGRDCRSPTSSHTPWQANQEHHKTTLVLKHILRCSQLAQSNIFFVLCIDCLHLALLINYNFFMAQNWTISR